MTRPGLIAMDLQMTDAEPVRRSPRLSAQPYAKAEKNRPKHYADNRPRQKHQQQSGKAIQQPSSGRGKPRSSRK